MRPLLISHADGPGGADVAAYRIHRALRSIDVDSTMAVAEVAEHGDDPSVRPLPYAHAPGQQFLRSHVGDWALWLQQSRNPMHRSINIVPSGALGFVNAPSWDVVHLHWMGSETLSIADIGRITRPVVWTLHDSWPFTGAEHHPEDAADDRFAVGYTRTSRRPGSARFDLDGWVFHRKARHWRQRIWLAAPSRYMADLAARSQLAGRWPVRVIPNPIDVTTFAPGDHARARADLRTRLGIPGDGPVILFGSSPGSARNKGWDLLEPALRTLAGRGEAEGAVAVVFGAEPPAASGDPGLPVRQLGRIADPAALAAVYRAATVMVVPSRLESFSQTAAEAQACGTPVVAFATSGLLDVVDDGRTGLLAAPEDSAALAQAIGRLTSDAGLRGRLGEAGRARAVERWSPPVVAEAYLALYAEAIAGQRSA